MIHTGLHSPFLAFSKYLFLQGRVFSIFILLLWKPYMRFENKQLSVDSLVGATKYAPHIEEDDVPDRDHNRHGRTRIHRLNRGLFILRYVASKAPTEASARHIDAPKVRITPQNKADVELIAWPDAAAHELRGPGDGLVIRALRDATLALEVVPAFVGGSLDAELHLEPVSRLAHAEAQQQDPITPLGDVEQAAVEADRIEVLAHVARRGDIVVPTGEWICGPDYPMAIEGLEFRWPRRPAGLDIVTRVSVSRNGIHELPASLTGEFAGTRGRAAPITRLDISLTGERAKAFVLRSEALFLGSSVQSKSGRSVSLAGPTGREPLVGLRLSVVALEAFGAAQAASRPLPQETKAGTGWSSGGRVRVFRGLKKAGADSPSRVRERA
ncbi:hypothetical protein FHP25_36875 [Vineibacter terrae]|uniref:Uncharacterized protein n=1 Tax=Vineibacter terrae TaxID=2586908 RepID=A0A5C8P807_9HYPH|nr:hypothetical protein [Vineibacter terrae]TXL69887.1 hypothetical protein FHP25_36875 [Vineibacter terrae]